MKEIISKYWKINLLLIIVVYVAYRILIADTTKRGDGLSATVLDILDIAINLGFSFIYLVVMVVCSFTIFLNNVKTIRDNRLLSWLTFSGCPLLFLLFVVVNILKDGFHGDVMAKPLVVITLYPLFTILLFLKFRKSFLLSQTHAYCSAASRDNTSRQYISFL